MDDQRYPFAHTPYPQVANDLVNDPTPKDQAIYVPSVSPGYAKDAYAQKWSRDMPAGVADGDLNFLDPQNKLFRISHAMTSAGQALNQKQPCIITERDRKSTLIIGDSGGYQIASNRMRINGDPDRLKILRWLEATADVAMTLDGRPRMEQFLSGLRVSKAFSIGWDNLLALLKIVPQVAREALIDCIVTSYPEPAYSVELYELFKSDVALESCARNMNDRVNKLIGV